jgi:hypothetical protein
VTHIFNERTKVDGVVDVGGDVVDEGGVEKLNVTDVSTEGLLTDILKELKKMNLHLSLMTDVDIKNTEVG